MRLSENSGKICTLITTTVIKNLIHLHESVLMKTTPLFRHADSEWQPPEQLLNVISQS